MSLGSVAILGNLICNKTLHLIAFEVNDPCFVNGHEGICIPTDERSRAFCDAVGATLAGSPDCGNHPRNPNAGGYGGGAGGGQGPRLLCCHLTNG